MKGIERLCSSEEPKDKEGRQYHISVAPGELSPYILLCGDPDRAERVKNLFEKVDYERKHREYLTFTGAYHSFPLSVMSTGIGCDNTEIAVIEASHCIKNPTFIRIGSCGAIPAKINLGDLVITTEALRHESTSESYLPKNIRVYSNLEVTNALIKAAKELGYKYHVGKTCTTSSFYGSQGREIEGFPIRDKSLVERLRKENVLNFEMESSTLFALAKVSTYKIRAGTVCAVYANRESKSFISDKEMKDAEMKCILTGLSAMEKLYKGDKIKF